MSDLLQFVVGCARWQRIDVIITIAGTDRVHVWPPSAVTPPLPLMQTSHNPMFTARGT